jgi:hypothetical protein
MEPSWDIAGITLGYFIDGKEKLLRLMINKVGFCKNIIYLYGKLPLYVGNNILKSVFPWDKFVFYMGRIDFFNVRD